MIIKSPVMALLPKEKQAESSCEWSVEDEIQLLYALTDLKPVGINRHFYMACIAERLSRALNRDIPSEHVWSHLKTLYNLDFLNAQEPLPFPNDEEEFSLPEVEFSALMSKKRFESEDTRLNSLGDNEPPSIIAVVTDNTNRMSNRDLERKITTAATTKLSDLSKRAPKRTRGSISVESSSPSTTPPPVQTIKRRRL